MQELDLLLAVAIVAVASLSSLTNLFVIHRFWHITPTPSPPTAESDQEDEEETDEESEEEAEGETNKAPSKEAILARRAQLVHELEEERGSRVLTLIHRKEPWSASDEEPEIGFEDSEYILQEVRQTPPDKPIDLIVHTEGGLTFAADLMAMALRYHKAKVTVMVPFYAMSDGTYLVLAADEIMMEKCSIRPHGFGKCKRVREMAIERSHERRPGHTSC